MHARIIQLSGASLLCVVLGSSFALAQDSEAPAEKPGATVSADAQLLKDADEIVLSAQGLKPIALDSIPAEINLDSLPGSAVSDVARTLRDLDPADIPGTARTLGDTARSNLPGAAGSHALAHSHALPSAASGRGRGRR